MSPALAAVIVLVAERHAQLLEHRADPPGTVVAVILMVGQRMFLICYSAIGSLSIYYPDEELGTPLAKKTFMGYI